MSLKNCEYCGERIDPEESPLDGRKDYISPYLDHVHENHFEELTDE